MEVAHSSPTLDPPKPAARPFDVRDVRKDFPILEREINGRPLVWLDNSATTQKPRAVIDRCTYLFTHENSHIHRSAHALAGLAEDAYEGARARVARFLNAPSASEIVWVRGVTEGINMVAQSWGRANLKKDDEVVITALEHHANILPWQDVCREKGAHLRIAPVDDRGQILLDEFKKLLGPRTRMVAMTHVSNALGTVTPVYDMVELAHKAGALVLVDGAQAASHIKVDVQSLDCDFYVVSGHKIYAPWGIGALYGKPGVLAAMPPWQSGGGIITEVTYQDAKYLPPPHRFEAGTGNVVGAAGFGAAVDYVESLGRDNIARHEDDLLHYITEELKRINGVTIFGTAEHKAGLTSFLVDGFTPAQVGKALDQNGVCVRCHNHCAQPIHNRFGISHSVRASFGMYNTREDIDVLLDTVRSLKKH